MIATGQAGRGRGLRLGLDRRVLGQRRLHPAVLDRGPHLAHQALHRPGAALGPHAGGHRDERDDARPALGRAHAPRPRRQRPAGRRGLVRRPVPQAARPHPRVRPDLPRHLAPRGPGHQRPASTTRCPTRAAPGWASRSRRTCTRCAPRSRSSSAPRGPKNVALAAEIARRLAADLLRRRRRAPAVYADALSTAKPGFEIACPVTVVINDDAQAALEWVKLTMALLHRRHGRQGQELPPRRGLALRLRGGRRTRCRSCSSPATATAP